MISTSIELRPLRRDERAAAAGVAGRALGDNPLNRAIYGPDHGHRVRRTEAAYRAFLPTLACPPLGAYRGRTPIGVVGVAPPGACQRPLLQYLPLACSLMLQGPSSLARLSRVFTEWSRHDPAERHWHLDPVAVEPQWQGQGVGSRMMGRFCAWMDNAGDAAYLETDKPENVAFYQKFGFAVVGEVAVLETATWLMRREPM